MIELEERRPVESVTVFISVILFYAFVLWLLMVLMNLHQKKEYVPDPVQVQVIDVAAPSAAAAAQAVQPPAPEMIVPPPPEIEPPPINAEAPVQTEPPKVVKKQAPKKKAASKPVPATSSREQSNTPSNSVGKAGQGAASTAGMGQPDRTAGSRPLNGVKLVYPQEMESAGREGRVLVDCNVEPSGNTSNCHVVSASGGSAFVEEALRYVTSARYRPAVRNGMPVREIGHRYTISFKLDGG